MTLWKILELIDRIYKYLLNKIDSLMDAEPHSDKMIKLKVFTFIVEKFEDVFYPIKET